MKTYRLRIYCAPASFKKKDRQQNTEASIHICMYCGKDCHSRIGGLLNRYQAFSIFLCRGMYHTVDATKEDQGPIRDNQIQMSLYYVCFVVVFSFFFLNMFVALIIVTFQEQGEKEMDGSELDRNQVIF